MGLFGGGNSTKKTSYQANTSVSAPTTIVTNGLNSHDAVALAGAISRDSYNASAAASAAQVSLAKLFIAGNVASARTYAAAAAPAPAPPSSPGGIFDSVGKPLAIYIVAGIVVALVMRNK